MTKKTVKIIAIIMFVMCLLFQAGFILGICTGSGSLFWNIFCSLILIVAKVIIIKAYPTYAKYYGGPKF